jgi:pimeloyl-ACP methyl ester carboxylesterase
MPDTASNAGAAAVAPPDAIRRSDGATIAYHYTPGKSPGIVFLTGFKSDMTGDKALALEAFARARGQSFLRFDYTGHGASSGRFEDGTIGQWVEDAVFALDRLTAGPQVLVGSSMGGWVMLLAALKRPERVVGLVGTAAAPDFTEDLLWKAFSDDQRAALLRDGMVPVPNCYDKDPYPITRRLIEEGRHHLLLHDAIPLAVPVRLIHGTDDRDVPWPTSIRLAEKLASMDVEITLVKNGDHRLSTPKDLERLCAVVGRLLDRLEAAP